MRKANLFAATIVTVGLAIVSGSSLSVWASTAAPEFDAGLQVEAATRADVRVILPSLYELPSLEDARPADAPGLKLAEPGAQAFPVALKTDLGATVSPMATATVASLASEELATTVLVRTATVQVASR